MVFAAVLGDTVGCVGGVTGRMSRSSIVTMSIKPLNDVHRAGYADGDGTPVIIAQR